MIRDLQAIHPQDRPLVGGKAANVGELARAGFPVPPGFVVTTDAYARFVVTNGLEPVLAKAALEPDLRSLAREIAQSFREGRMSPALEEAIIAAYERLGANAVAVRSSATSEDLVAAASAGQQESLLGVVGVEQLLQAVRTCWASLWSERAVSYRRRRSLAQEPPAIAILVQPMLDAQRAGVVFTVNPVTGNANEMMVEALWGLGTPLVSGRVTPDHWTIDRGSRRIAGARVASKRTMVTCRGGTLQQEPVPVAWQEAPVLDEQALFELVDVAGQVEAHFGSPQDIEWAYVQDDLYLLQARAVTQRF
jgi:phosphoenolpyruvate synthase/pyruvate phosphate dikinase